MGLGLNSGSFVVGGSSSIAFELTSGVIFTQAVPFTITCTSGTHNIVANSATTVTTLGTTGNLTLSATAASTVNLASLTSCVGLNLTAANPTLTLPANVAGVFGFSSTTRTALVIPGSCTSVSITAAALATITSIGTLDAALSSFTLNTVGAVNSIGIELILTRCATVAATPTAVAVNISGGTNAAPTGTPTSATGQIVCPMGAALNVTGSASWVKPRWKTTERYFWLNVSLGNTDPSPGGTGIELAVSAADSAGTIATALETAMEANGYSSTRTGDTISYTADVTGPGSTAGSQDAGEVFILQTEVDGTVGNASINTIVANGGTVTHN